MRFVVLPITSFGFIAFGIAFGAEFGSPWSVIGGFVGAIIGISLYSFAQIINR